MPTTILNTGHPMPLLGLGVWQIKNGVATETAVQTALGDGYRLIDTAKIYRNEESVGRAVKNSGIPRENVFVTTKLWPTDFFRAEAAFHDSLSRLGMEYVDLYLIHWPTPMGKGRAWKTLEKIYTEGHTRAIGVSNYGIRDLEKLSSANIVPAVNQIKMSPYSYNPELLAYCRDRNIIVEAYSPLTRGHHLHDPRLLRIATTYQKSSAQILLRWSLQHNAVVIPKAENPLHIRENAEIFGWEISEGDMATLDALSNI